MATVALSSSVSTAEITIPYVPDERSFGLMYLSGSLNVCVGAVAPYPCDNLCVRNFRAAARGRAFAPDRGPALPPPLVAAAAPADQGG
jgi:hypothetical protein